MVRKPWQYMYKMAAGNTEIWNLKGEGDLSALVEILGQLIFCSRIAADYIHISYILSFHMAQL